MPAFLERLADGIFILRAGPRAVAYGDPYTAAAVIVALGEGACEVKGFIRKSDEPDLAVFRDIGECLKAAGFYKYTWDRQGAGGFRHAEIGK
jgi:hypothetical protein